MHYSERINLRKGLAWLAFFLLVTGLVSYARHASGPGWDQVKSSRGANDFASYYYALNATISGENPYNSTTLTRLAKADKRPGVVHPFFYPPPYLLSMAWATPMALQPAHQVFYWLGSLFLLSVLLALWKWLPCWGLFGASGLVLLFYTPIVDTLRMGQANLLVLALVVWGVLLVEFEGANKRRWLGGGLVGLACMLKMSPALLVFWWMVRREWRPVIAAGLAAIGSSLLVLPLVDFSTQLYFYAEVLPSFTSGGYHGLTVPINIPMNHSILNFCMQITSGFQGMTRNTEATALASNLARALSLSTLLCLFVLLRRPKPDAVSRANAASAFVVLMVLAPAFTYEHHLVFLIFPVLSVAAALSERRLHWLWAGVLIALFAVLAWDLQSFKALSASLGGGRLWSPGAVALRELKFLAAVTLGGLCVLAALSPQLRSPSLIGGKSLSMPRVMRRDPQEGSWLE